MKREDRTRDFIRPLLEGIVDPKAFADAEFVKEAVLKWIHTQGPTWSWYEQLVRKTVQRATGLGLESAAHIADVPDERNHPVAITDSGPNDTTLPDAQKHE